MITDERLAAIEQSLEDAGDPPATFARLVGEDVPALVAEVRALRQIIRDLVPILQQVAAEEFERAMRPEPRVSSSVVRPIYQDLAARLSAYVDAIGMEGTDAH